MAARELVPVGTCPAEESPYHGLRRTGPNIRSGHRCYRLITGRRVTRWLITGWVGRYHRRSSISGDYRRTAVQCVLEGRRRGAVVEGSNWSTGSPPTAAQAACITRALTGPVVLSGAGAARSLTLGGLGGTAELELNGATLALGAGSTVAPTGTLVAIGAGSTVQVRHGALLSNHGVVTVLAEGLQLEGSFTNTPVGTVNVDETGGWRSSAFAGTLTVGISSSFTNQGTVWVQPYGSIKAPSGPAAVIDNAAGTIFTAGNITVGPGAAFVEGGGRVVGSVIGNYNRVIVDGGMLDLAGPGTSTFQLQGAARLEGTVAPDQVVATFSSPSLATVGSVTNEGLITTQYANATLTVPTGSTLVNRGATAPVPFSMLTARQRSTRRQRH